MRKLLGKNFERALAKVDDPKDRDLLRMAAAKYPEVKGFLVYQNYRSSAPSEMDYARLAAYIDGEGTIDIGESKNTGQGGSGYSLDLGVFNSDPRLMGWLLERWGGEIHPTVKNGNLYFKWYCASADRLEVLTRCRPYFVIKPEQCNVALRFLKLQVGHTFGRKGAPPEIKEGKRQCRDAIRQMHNVRVRESGEVVVRERGYVQ